MVYRYLTIIWQVNKIKIMITKHQWVGFGLAILTPLIYIFTIHPATKAYSFPLVIVALIITLSSYLFRRQNTTLLMYATTIFILLLVGTTGWYFSPFFNWIYLLAIALAFLFDPNVSSLFVIVLLALFLPNVGSIDTILDMLVLLSLVAIIPLTYFLRNEYLRLRENEKKILVLEQEKNKYKDVLEQVLANKVTKFAVELREPINDIKQIAYFNQQAKNVKEVAKNQSKIIKLSEEALNQLKGFEEKTTGKKLVKTPKEKS